MSIILYGVGKHFKETVCDESFYDAVFKCNHIRISAICDGKKEKHGQCLEICRHKMVINCIDDVRYMDFDKVLITSASYYDDIRRELSEKGIPEERIAPMDRWINDLLFKQSFKYDLSLVLIIRNEAVYVKEWIEYHKLKGVDHFYIYDDESSDHLQETLGGYIEEGIVTYMQWKHEDGQANAYQDAVRRFKDETRYMGFIDTDEFIVTKDEESICEVVEQIRTHYENEMLFYHPMEWHVGGIGLNFRYFGTGGHKKKPKGLVIENYLYHAPDTHPDHSFIKSIVNPRVVTECGVHCEKYISGYICISENGSRIDEMNFMDGRYDRVWINHYWTRSEEEMKQKYKRGWIAGVKEHVDADERTKLFAKELEKVKCFNTVYDGGMLRYSEILKKRGFM